MVKHYFAGLLVTVLMVTALFVPVNAEEDLDTGISPDDEVVEVIPYPELKIDDNNVDVLNVQSRLRDLGYYNYKVTGYYGSLTEYAVKLFQKYNGLEETGKVDEATNKILYENNAVRMPMSGIDATADRFGVTPSPTPTPTPTPKPTPKPTAKATAKPNNNNNSKPTVTKKPTFNTATGNGKVAPGEYMDWSQVKGIFAKGTKATVYDFNTGVSWTVKRTGGSKHADVEPVSATDTALYKQALGKYYKNWRRQPCVVLVGGYRIAGSYHGYPHGYDAIAGNNMTGHYCIHFKNSRTHCSNKIDPDHQACVRKSAGL